MVHCMRAGASRILAKANSSAVPAAIRTAPTKAPSRRSQTTRPSITPSKRHSRMSQAARMSGTAQGIHGSTSEHRDRLCAVVPVSHEYLGATASDLGSVGECAELTSLVRVLVSGWKMCTSNKGTGGMESSVVLFKPRIRLFVCIHPSVSNTLDCNALFECKHQSVALVQTRLVCGSLFVYKHRSTALVQIRLNGDSLFVYKHQSPALQSPALCVKHV